MSLTELHLKVLVEHAQRERLSAGPRPSPACVELFRRAFRGEQQAWAAINEIFRPLMLAWIGTQSVVEVEEVLQEALLAFTRYAPQHPSLVEREELGPVLEYLRKSTKTALLSLLRRERANAVGRGTFSRADEEQLSDLPSGMDIVLAAELRLVLWQRVRELLEDDEEQLLFNLYFVCEMSPRAILSAYPERFPDVKAINTLVQRLTRRLRKDTMVRELADIHQQT